MKSTDIKRLAKKIRIKSSAVNHDRILTDAEAVLVKSTKNGSKVSRPAISIWRTIMKSRITKLAAAAVIIVAVLIGINQLGGSIDGASVAWGEVVEQINNYTKYKCRQRVVRQQGPEYITVELYPDQMKATVTKLVGFGPRKDPHIIEMVKRFEQESTERLGTKKRNGKILHGFRHKPNKHNDYTVWVDADTKLPVEIELVHTQAGQTIFLDDFEFDFELDPSAFSTDIPDGYEVKTLIQDYRPIEPKEITAEDIRSELNHTAYAVGKLMWIEEMIIIQTADPLGGRAKAYLTGVISDDGNAIVIVQGDYYDEEIMVWLPDQQLVLEASNGVKLYTHPRGSEYAQYFLESFAKANPEFFDMNNLSEERFTRMIAMPDGTVLGLVANKQMSDEKLQEFVESLVEIKAN